MALIDYDFKNKGEEGAFPIKKDIMQNIVNAINSLDEKIKGIDERTKHITSDEIGTHFVNGVFANGNELVADNEHKDPSVQAISLEMEEENDV